MDVAASPTILLKKKIISRGFPARLRSRYANEHYRRERHTVATKSAKTNKPTKETNRERVRNSVKKKKLGKIKEITRSLGGRTENVGNVSSGRFFIYFYL